MEASSVSALFYRPGAPAVSTRLRLCSDDQLVERYRAGRDEAFLTIHDRYRARLRAYVRQMLGDRPKEDVEDVLQEVFERAARTLRGEAAPIGLRAWLYSVARNRCIDELRRRPPCQPDMLAAARLPAADTGAVAERRADVERLFADLRALPELQRSALLMRELQGLSHAELAEVLEASVPAVKSLIVRARVGLIDAEAARELPCAVVRDELAAAHDRQVKTGARAGRHLRECSGCRAYRAELRRTSRRLAALVPGPALFPLVGLGRLLGAAGHGEAPAAAGALAGSGGAAVAGAGKLAAVLGAVSLAATGAVLEGNRALNGRLPWAQAPVAHQRATAGSALGTVRGVPTAAGHRPSPSRASGPATPGGPLGPGAAGPTPAPSSAAAPPPPPASGGPGLPAGIQGPGPAAQAAPAGPSAADPAQSSAGAGVGGGGAASAAAGLTSAAAGVATGDGSTGGPGAGSPTSAAVAPGGGPAKGAASVATQAAPVISGVAVGASRVADAVGAGGAGVAASHPVAAPIPDVTSKLAGGLP